MKNFNSALIITHIAFRTNNPEIPIEGPYSSVSKALTELGIPTTLLGLPLFKDKVNVLFGVWPKQKTISMPKWVGKLRALDYFLDFITSIFILLRWSINCFDKRKVVIAIDPLSAIPAILLKNILGYKLIYHCVDFNRERFSLSILQKIYQLSDEIASRFSDQTWVICQALLDYKSKHYGTKSFYMPNSVKYEKSLAIQGRSQRDGKKMIWTGGLMTKRQYKILFSTLKYIQDKIRKDIQFVIAPTKDYEQIEEYMRKYKLKRTKLLKLNSRLEFQKVAATCDVGIALYDEKFGSTEFIEPMKIWDFMLCGLPFIVSSEPSISSKILESGVAYRLLPKNKILLDGSLRLFLMNANLMSKFESCQKIAKMYDIKTVIKKQLSLLI